MQGDGNDRSAAEKPAGEGKRSNRQLGVGALRGDFEGNYVGETGGGRGGEGLVRRVNGGKRGRRGGNRGGE